MFSDIKEKKKELLEVGGIRPVYIKLKQKQD